MPIIINPEAMPVTRQGEGWAEITLADAQTIGAPAMVARRWVLGPGARGPELVQGEVDQLLYVIRGSGLAVVNGQEFRLSEESLLWLEPGESYQFIGGAEGLEILQGYNHPEKLSPDL
jgi:quercetin dioxygenase-like cupin family protein